MLKQTGSFKTQFASKYLQQLCKHFAHKVKVEYDSQQGDVNFPFGKACLFAQEGALIVHISAEDDDALAKARSVIDVHLKTFAFREDFDEMEWRDV